MTDIRQHLKERILILDGAMGSLIQTYKTDEAGYRGDRFVDWPSDVKGNNDLLVLTQPQIINDIHKAYLEAGADIIDIGGESTRAGAQAVSLQKELDRVIPVINSLAKQLSIPISIDTSQPEVMR